MLRGRTLGVVMPAHCEEALVRHAIERVPSFVDAIWVVDDGSTDRTSDEALAAGDARVQLIRFEENRGVGAAIAAGYAAAFTAGIDVACVMAGDAQMDPRDLEGLVAPILEETADYVVGDRLAWPHARRTMPLSRFLGNHVLTLLSRVTLGLAIGDSQCGYTALSREAGARVALDSLWPRYGYPNDLLALVSGAGLRIATRPVRPVYGEEKSGVGLRHAVFVIPFVLVRAWLRRQLGQRLAPALPLVATDVEER
jgi:glycosyltransferase involved in cell wall biosynthesis